jgi:hypothetical protein
MDAPASRRGLERFIKDRLGSRSGAGSMLELSRTAGIRPNTFYDWFVGRRSPRTDSLARVAKALGVPTSALVDAYEGQERLALNDDALAAIRTAVAQGVEDAVRRLQDEGRIGSPR